MPRRKRVPLMAFDLHRPCVDCPFLEPRDFPLSPNRAAEIAQSMEHSSFACHKTLEVLPQQHCAGVLVIMARTNAWGDMQQIAMRLGLFDPDRLDLSVPVYPDFDAFVRAKGGEPRPWRSARYRKENDDDGCAPGTEPGTDGGPGPRS
jgi:hypothetical protein